MNENNTPAEVREEIYMKYVITGEELPEVRVKYNLIEE